MPPFVLPFPQIDPAIFTLDLGGLTFSLRWYALAYIAGLVIGWRMVVWLMRRPRLWPAERAPMTPDQPEELLTWMTLGVILGGRLGYVLFYNPAHFLANPSEILAIWQGGMSFHGGFLGVILGVIGFALKRGAPVMSVGDAVALAAPLGILFGRLANFINGELWGRPTDVPWAMVFPHAGPEPRHPSQLYEAGLEGLLLGGVMWWLAVRGGWLKRPGGLIGVFFVGYGLARTFVENFRLADEQFISPDNPMGHVIRLGAGVDAWGLTMGQLLSLPMVAIGLGFLAVAFTRRPA
ncbi:prolipoprotein diacylglyceryl transferase [Limibaculum sp. FT325]|uniref:prolipoprotein diacylglyceryl transferase n=1 Tax=Thermohalobaculum sediminis TaxID=2939436 RepID=UPI0020BF3F7F|nr:prolipoprotein diacylglyceryl transferase [Limibaculum sediminis]MCL5778440.1 prolipoprotein diacylglyceryl transferase [Limibaculum sediminis]